jgi:regulator of sirC expression with transglutaminase-like and TPR domain
MNARHATIGAGAGFLLLAMSFPPTAAGADGPLVPELVAIEDGFHTVSGQVLRPGRLNARVAELMADLQKIPEVRAGGKEGVEALNRFVFGHLGIRATQDLRDPMNLLPSAVLERKQGYCVGIAAVYLILAEQLELPIFAVATPSHVFLRFDEGTTRLNIETFQQGANVPDEQYIREHRIPETSIRRGVFLRNLTPDGFLAQVHNNLGVIYSERKEYAKAAAEYRLAIELHLRFPAAFYNHGNDLLAQGQFRKAVRKFSRALRLYPTDVWALNNRGLAELKLGWDEEARWDFEEALRIEPGFEQARRNLEVSP